MHHHQNIFCLDHLTFLDTDLFYLSTMGCVDMSPHFHGLDNGHQIALIYRVAHLRLVLAVVAHPHDLRCHRFPFLAAVDAGRFLQLGGYISVERGQYEQSWDIIFADPTKNTALSKQEWQMRGLGYGFGIVTRPPGGVSLGVTYDAGVDYDSDIVEEHTNPSSNRTVTETIKMPERWTFSAAWRFHRMFSAYGTYSFRDFTKFAGRPFSAERLYSEETAALGFEYHRGLKLGKTRLPLRLGATWTRLPYDYPAGERITGILFELGLGLKFRSGRGKIDLAFQAGTTGDLSTNGIEDRVFRVYLGLSGAEVWRRHRQSGF